MKWIDTPHRAYYGQYEKVPVAHHQNWFEVYRLPKNVYAICEPQHFQEVNMFLIMGKERALLLDTGMGIRNLKPLVKELYPGAIITVNSHFHFDHVGDNWRFQPVHVFNDPCARHASENGVTAADLGDQLDEDMFRMGYPEGFVPNEYWIPPYEVKTVEDGQVFDLGGRTLHVYHTPGHCNDAIMLYDEQARILFTGDSFYLGALYAHFHCHQFGHSDLKAYAASLQQMANKLTQLKALYVSHNDFIVEPAKLKEAADGLAAIQEGSARPKGSMDQGHTYLEGGRQLVQVPFDGFSVIVEDIKPAAG